jgi:hypothetical protein
MKINKIKVRTWGSLKEREVIILKGLEKEPMTVNEIKIVGNKAIVKCTSWKDNYVCTHKSTDEVTVCE